MFDLQMVEFTDKEPADMEGWLYSSYVLLLTSHLKRSGLKQEQVF